MISIESALVSLGVNEQTLSQSEKDNLDRDGYALFKNILGLDEIESIRNRQIELLNEEGEKAGSEVHRESGTDRLSDLMNKGSVFWVIFRKPKILAAIAHVLKKRFQAVFFELAQRPSRTGTSGSSCGLGQT